MTGSDPQFLVRGPFRRGVWEWTLRGGVRGDSPSGTTQIYPAPAGASSGPAGVGFPPFARDPAARTLRFWLPYDASVLRFDPADAPGTLVLGDVIARRRGRLAATASAFARQARQHGARGVIEWLGPAVEARRHRQSAPPAT